MMVRGLQKLMVDRGTNTNKMMVDRGTNTKK